MEDLIDLDRYPITRISSPAGKELLAEGRAKLSRNGVCLLPQFITPAAVARMAAEVDDVVEQAYYCADAHNPYLERDDARFPIDHPRRRHQHTNLGAVAYDLIPAAATLRRLYEWDPLMDFVAAVLGQGRLYRMADPLAALTINVMGDGECHGWHFDEAEYTTTLMLQTPEGGGQFQCVPMIRSSEDENYTAVARILTGQYKGVATLAMQPGTMLIFAGHNSIHRVTPVEGVGRRYVATRCYKTEPGVRNSDEVRTLFYGRTG